ERDPDAAGREETPATHVTSSPGQAEREWQERRREGAGRQATKRRGRGGGGRGPRGRGGGRGGRENEPGEKGGGDGVELPGPGGGAQGAEDGVASRPSEGRADIGALPRLQQHQPDDDQAHEDVDEDDQDEHARVTPLTSRPARRTSSRW